MSLENNVTIQTREMAAGSGFFYVSNKPDVSYKPAEGMVVDLLSESYSINSTRISQFFPAKIKPDYIQVLINQIRGKIGLISGQDVATLRDNSYLLVNPESRGQAESAVYYTDTEKHIVAVLRANGGLGREELTDQLSNTFGLCFSYGNLSVCLGRIKDKMPKISSDTLLSIGKQTRKEYVVMTPEAMAALKAEEELQNAAVANNNQIIK